MHFYTFTQTFGLDGWTRAITATRNIEYVPGTPYPAWGVALLWYRWERRLSVSIWTPRWSRNFRVWGPKLLSWQR